MSCNLGFFSSFVSRMVFLYKTFLINFNCPLILRRALVMLESPFFNFLEYSLCFLIRPTISLISGHLFCSLDQSKGWLELTDISMNWLGRLAAPPHMVSQYPYEIILLLHMAFTDWVLIDSSKSTISGSLRMFGHWMRLKASASTFVMPDL